MDNNEEIWLDIPEYIGLYQASTYGRIKALEKFREIGNTGTIRVYHEKIMVQRKLPKKKYLYVILCKKGRRKSYTVHRLIALTHVANPEQLPEVNHEDCYTFNNYANNLKWTTRKGNTEHAVANGLIPSLFGNEGIKNPSSRKVIDLVTGIEYESITDGAKSTKFSLRSVMHQLNGEQKNKTNLKFI